MGDCSFGVTPAKIDHTHLILEYVQSRTEHVTTKNETLDGHDEGMSLSKRKDKEKDKNKGSSRSRLFGRKATKRELPPKRPIQSPSQSPSPTLTQSSGYSTHNHPAPPSNGFAEGFASPHQRAGDAMSPRNNRIHRASILLTADEFDALANTNYSNSFSPTLSSRVPTSPTSPSANRKRDLSVVASDMSSTTRLDSQKVYTRCLYS